MPSKLNLDGVRFGRLVVIRRSEVKQGNNPMMECICDCGTKKLVRLSHLRSGSTKSCGCLNIEKIKKMASSHGKSKSRAYQSWAMMIQRCNNPNRESYKYYGERGIKVCPEWLDFEQFYKDMGECPENCSIDRIDNDGDYCPDNCQWSTKIEQANNTRVNTFIEYDGKRLTIPQWARLLNISRGTLAYRYYSGWSIEEIFNRPIRKSK